MPGFFSFRKSVTSSGFEGTHTPVWALAIGTVGFVIAIVASLTMYGALRRGEWATVGTGLAAAALGLLVLLIPIFVARRAVVIDEVGIRRELTRGRWVAIAWSEPHECHLKSVRHIRGQRPISGSHWIWVRTPDGREIAITDTFRPEHEATSASAYVIRRSTQQNLPEMRRALLAGRELAFGPIRLSSGRLVVGAQVIAGPPASHGLAVKNGQVLLCREREELPTGIAMEHVANLSCLLTLARPPASGNRSEFRG